MSISRHGLLSMLALTFSVAWAAAPAGPESASQFGSIESQRITVFEADRSKQDGLVWAHRLGAVQASQHTKDAGFGAVARVALKTEPALLLVEQRPLTYFTPLADSVPDWRARDGLFTWRGRGNHATPMTLLLKAVGDQSSLRLNEYDALWVEYTPTPGVSTCHPVVQLETEARTHNGKASQVTRERWSAETLETLETLDAHEAAWQARDNQYLIGRVLHLKPDPYWRYLQNQKNVVLQRRMHVNLSAAVVMDIAVAPGTMLEGVNLLVRQKDDYGPGELVKFVDLPPASHLPDGRVVVRLNLREALNKKFPDLLIGQPGKPNDQAIYLQEVVLHLPGEVRQVAASRPLQGMIITKAMAAVTDSRTQTLFVQNTAVNAYSRRVVIDLRQLTDHADVSLNAATLRLQPNQHEGACTIRLDAIRLVGTHRGRVPTYVRSIEDWSRRLGGPFKLTAPEQGRVEQPGIIGYLLLDGLSGAQSQREVGPGTMTLGQQSKDRILTASLPYRILTKEGRPVVDATPVANRMDVEVVDDPSRYLRWPINANIGPDTLFYLGAGEHIERIASVEVTLLTADGQRLIRRVPPNQPVRLVQRPTRLTEVRLETHPMALSQPLNLRELVLFEPSVVDYAQAMRVPLPTSLKLSPEPNQGNSVVGTLKMQSGHVAGSVDALGFAQFSTALANPLDEVQGLNLSYHLPYIFSLDGPCPLVLTFRWTRGSLERQLCPSTSVGSMFIPMTAWLGGLDTRQVMGSLRSIDWRVSLPKSSVHNTDETFALDFSVEGWAKLSALDQVRQSSLFQADGRPVFADSTGFVDAIGARAASKFWLPLEAGSLARIAAAKAGVVPTEHPLFKLEQVALQPTKVLDWAHWQRLSNPPTPPPSLRWLRWVLWSGAFFLIWVSVRRGWWSPSQAWICAMRSICSARRLTRQGLRHLGVWVWRILPWINLGVGCLALLLLWLAGRFVGEYAGLMLGSLAVLLVFGAYRHWRTRPALGAEGLMQIQRPDLVGRVLWALALANAVWALGYFGLGRQLLWGGLPLLGVAYLVLPNVFRSTQAWGSRFPGLWRWLGWSAVTVALYVMGLMLSAETGENYFFTCGGIAAMLALRAAFLVLEPWLRRVVPAAASHIFGGAGSLYFSGALVGLLGTALLLSVKLDPLAEQLAVIVYFCLVIGTVKEIVSLRRTQSSRTDSPRQPDSSA